jgi:hypothetical protein
VAALVPLLLTVAALFLPAAGQFLPVRPGVSAGTGMVGSVLVGSAQGSGDARVGLSPSSRAHLHTVQRTAGLDPPGPGPAVLARGGAALTLLLLGLAVLPAARPGTRRTASPRGRGPPFAARLFMP